MTQYVAKKDNNFLTCAAGRSREVILSLYPTLRRHSRSGVSSAVLPERRKRKAYSNKLSKGPWRWVRAWSIWHMKRVWKKVHYSARKKRRLRYCLFLFLHLYVYLIGRKKEQDCFQLSGQDKMQWAQTEIVGMLFKHKKMLFHSKGGQTLQQVAHRGSEILHLGDSKPNWSQPWAPLFEQGVGVGALQRSFPTLFNVWYALVGLSCQISIYLKNINEFSLITLLKGDNYAHSNNAHLKSEAEQRKAKEHLKSPKQDKSWHSYINN